MWVCVIFEVSVTNDLCYGDLIRKQIQQIKKKELRCDYDTPQRIFWLITSRSHWCGGWVESERGRLSDRFRVLPSPAVIPEDIRAKTRHRRTAPLTHNRPHNTLGLTPLPLCMCVWMCAVLFPWVLIHTSPFPSIHNSGEVGLSHSLPQLHCMLMGHILPRGLPDGCHYNRINQYDFPSSSRFDFLKCLSSINMKTVIQQETAGVSLSVLQYSI